MSNSNKIRYPSDGEYLSLDEETDSDSNASNNENTMWPNNILNFGCLQQVICSPVLPQKTLRERVHVLAGLR